MLWLGKGFDEWCFFLRFTPLSSLGGDAGGDGVFAPAENWDMKERTGVAESQQRVSIDVVVAGSYAH